MRNPKYDSGDGGAAKAIENSASRMSARQFRIMSKQINMWNSFERLCIGKRKDRPHKTIRHGQVAVPPGYSVMSHEPRSGFAAPYVSETSCRYRRADSGGTERCPASRGALDIHLVPASLRGAASQDDRVSARRRRGGKHQPRRTWSAARLGDFQPPEQGLRAVVWFPVDLGSSRKSEGRRASTRIADSAAL